MGNSSSSNAILTKARAKYGKRLSEKDYQNLLSCRNVGEIANYLKANTYYSSTLKNVDISDIHRRQLEIILQSKILTDFEVLHKYYNAKRGFSYPFAMKIISDYIFKVVICIDSGEPVGLTYIPPSFGKMLNMDFDALSKARTKEELFEALKGTPFNDMMDASIERVQKTGKMKYFEFEDMLYRFVVSKFVELSNALSRSSLKVLKGIFTDLIDSENYIRIIRLKRRYGHLKGEEMKKYLIDMGTLNEKGFIDKACALETESEAKKMLDATPIGRKLSKFECVYVDELKDKLKNQICKHYIRYSLDVPTVAISYAMLLEVELKNIIHIIEGVRYGVNKNEIEALLIK